MSASRAESAVRLPWLAPGAEALASLARRDVAPVADHLTRDPGFALLWLRCGAPAIDDAFDPTPMIRSALAALDLPPAGRFDVSLPAVQSALQFSRRCAAAATSAASDSGYPDPIRAGVAAATSAASDSGYPDPIRAGVAALLAPLGWLAMAAVNPDSVAAVLNDPGFVESPESVALRVWGASSAALTRRLLRLWGLPAWFTAVIANLDLQAHWVKPVAGDDGLTRIIQRAIHFAARDGDPLRFACRIPRPQSEKDNDFPAVAPTPTDAIADPYSAPLVRELLVLALDGRAARQSALVESLERENEALRQIVHDTACRFDEQLSSRKLAALAEFAAGAGHEINNPLAVISGQAQYLLIKEMEPDRQRALHAVVQQAQRIHHILTDLMQFARPAKPNKRSHDLCESAGAVATNLHEFAALQRVRIELLTPDEPCLIDADPKQIQTALASLLRNAVEAAPEDGWARVTIESHHERTLVIVENSGDGPTDAQRDHLFDPFYSGRKAGRGRGLGLPTAWRLARENGGDVTFDPRPDSPARFVLSLPRDAEPFTHISMSA